MERVIKIQTSDGQLFDKYDDAKRHADKLVADKVSSICCKLCGLKYVQTVEYVMEHLNDFEELADLNRDLILRKDEDEDEDE